jgi:hypothetical protein
MVLIILARRTHKLQSQKFALGVRYAEAAVRVEDGAQRDFARLANIRGSRAAEKKKSPLAASAYR